MSWKFVVDWSRLEQPLNSGYLPRGLGGEVFGANAGVAGIGLLLSAFWGRRRTGFLALLAAILVLFGARMGLVLTGLQSTVSPKAQARILGMFVFILAVLPGFKVRPREPLCNQEPH
jgi:hypothetical protein